MFQTVCRMYRVKILSRRGEKRPFAYSLGREPMTVEEKMRRMHAASAKVRVVSQAKATKAASKAAELRRGGKLKAADLRKLQARERAQQRAEQRAAARLATAAKREAERVAKHAARLKVIEAKQAAPKPEAAPLITSEEWLAKNPTAKIERLAPGESSGTYGVRLKGNYSARWAA
ncbi:MAG TPA: hypothetical protein VFE72_12100 [Lysobacter sp.]|nr:hypothetical protein [Lysobacter sp.]